MKRGTYCKIIDYIEDVDKELYEIILSLCTERSLETSKNREGTTFLMPVDKEFRKKLMGLIASDKVGDLQIATKHILACVLTENLKSVADFNSKKSSIGNALRQIVAVKSASGSTVTFENGAKCTLETGFIDGSFRGNINIWRLEGSLPIDGAQAPQTNIRMTGARITMKTGAWDAPKNSNSVRILLAHMVEDDYRLKCIGQRSILPSKTNAYLTPHLQLTLSFCKWMKDNHEDIFFNRLLPMLSYLPGDFYNIIEPHCPVNSEYLVSHTLIEEWYATGAAVKPVNVMKLVIEFENAMKTHKCDCAIYLNRIELIDQIDEIRQEISEIISTRHYEACEVIQKTYNKLIMENTIGTVKNVFPASLHEFYRSRPLSRMVHDSIRYCSFIAFESLSIGSFDSSLYQSTIDDIFDQCHRQFASIMHPSTLTTLAKDHNINELLVFINSTMFMFIPLTNSDMDAVGSKYKFTLRVPQPPEIDLFFIDKLIRKRHVADNSAKIALLIESIEMDADTRQKIDEASQKL